MKVILINGSPHKAGTTYTALSEAERILKEEGVDLQPLYDALQQEFLSNNINDPWQPWCERMNKVKDIFDEISRK